MIRLQPAVLLATIAALGAGALAVSASSAATKAGPVKGATYIGLVHDTQVTIRVAASGKSAAAQMSRIPGYCQGGSGPETAHYKAALIRKGSFKETISFTASGSSKPFATAVIQGAFLGKDFDGSEKSTFKAGSTCNGQESFLATTTK